MVPGLSYVTPTSVGVPEVLVSSDQQRFTVFTYRRLGFSGAGEIQDPCRGSRGKVGCRTGVKGSLRPSWIEKVGRGGRQWDPQDCGGVRTRREACGPADD